jgi:uncharacterized protein YxjI
MRYQMKQKLFSWADRFAIRDEAGDEVAAVDGKAFSWSNQLTFTDRDGNELASIQQKLLSWGPTYEIYRGGELAAVVKKKQWSFSPTFIIDVPGPDDLTAKGNWSDMEYTFTRGDQEVAVVSRQWFAAGDSYGVEIADGEDAILILAATVVIDMVHQDER